MKSFGILLKLIWVLLVFMAFPLLGGAQTDTLQLQHFRRQLGLANFMLAQKTDPYSTEFVLPDGYTRHNESTTSYYLTAADGLRVLVRTEPGSEHMDDMEWYFAPVFKNGVLQYLLEKKYKSDGTEKGCEYFTNGAVGLSLCNAGKIGIRVLAYLPGPSGLQAEYTWEEPLGGRNIAVPDYSETPSTDQPAPTTSHDPKSLDNELKRTEDLATALRVRERADSFMDQVLKQYTDTSKTYTGKPLLSTHYQRYIQQLEPGEKTRRFWTVSYYFNSKRYLGQPDLPGNFPANYDHIPHVPEFFEIRLDTETGKATVERIRK